MNPKAQGERQPWESVALHVRERIESRLQAPVAQVVNQPSGFSPGAAARLVLADGSRVFVKAASSVPNAETPDMHRREAVVAASLPNRVPAPKLRDSFDDGDWVALCFDDINGHQPAEPWDKAELDKVLAVIAELAEVDTAPVAKALDHDPLDGMNFWRRAAGQLGESSRLPIPDDPWIRANIERLVELEALAPAAIKGNSLVHADLRADNILLTPSQVFFVDWPHASLGAPWVDLVFLLPSVGMQGGPPPREVFDRQPVANAADPTAVTAVLAATTGYFVVQAATPPPPGLPGLRPFQQAQGEVALRWLRQRTGWRP